MSASNLRVVSLHSATSSETGDELSVLVVRSDGALCSLESRLARWSRGLTLSTQRVKEPGKENWMLAAEAELRSACRALFSA
jgi:hypothetical protein